MIALFPNPYDDELLYSTFARYYVRSGHIYYKTVSQELFYNYPTRNSWDFFPTLTDDAIRIITSLMPLEDVIMKHTMFPQCARFLPMERKISAFDGLLGKDTQFNNMFYTKSVQLDQQTRFRFCPICSKIDRQRYGETFWHRTHQLIGIDICTNHKCRLVDSSVELGADTKGNLISAESVIPLDINADFDIDELTFSVAKYIVDVFQHPMDLHNSIRIGDFIHAKLEKTKYSCDRGNVHWNNLLFCEFSDFFANYKNNSINNIRRLRNIISNTNTKFYDVCLLSYFLGIPVTELCTLSVPKEHHSVTYDSQVKLLKGKGLTYKEISQELNLNLSTVRAVGAGMYDITKGA